MAKVKIISNPYKKEIRYQQWDAETGTWADINLSNHKSSKLLSKELTGGFFPFIVKQIVDQIAEEYQAEGETVEIVFAGSKDEFLELESICSNGDYESEMKPVPAETYLENARDILPEVIKLFQEMSPLILQSVSQEKIQRDLSRFTDAASDVVPICVLGNYSSGKSTFINALIGYEILPNGSNPVTAKVYKISRSKYDDRAFVRFEYLGQPVTLHLTDRDSYFDNSQLPNELTEILTREVLGMTDDSLVLRMNKAISIINGYRSDEENSGVSDLIEIEVPFVKGVLAKSQHPFVIFDTPGSNSASNVRHLTVLKAAMANMTNGLPIFLATPDTLDSTDNENLYHIISELDELDSRFTMIVVNKADKNDLNRKESSAEEENLVLRQAIPRNLYSGGIFYVSSILGLGAKSGGVFVDDFYDETYEDQQRKYSDPANRRYKTLYVYNIMPPQIKKRSDSLSAAQENLVYANSGLFSIETEIETFAGKYAAYNKCFQSQMFLKKVIRITEEELKGQQADCESIRKNIQDKLETDKQKLWDSIKLKAFSKQDAYDDGYPAYMAGFLKTADETFTMQSLQEKERELTAAQEETLDFDGAENDVKANRSSIGQNLLQNLGKAAKNINFESIRTIGDGLQADVSSTIDSYKARSELRHEVDKSVADQLLAFVMNVYRTRLREIWATLDAESRNYWTTNTEELRDILAGIVSGSDVLTEERRQELERIIITYQTISFDESKVESIFQKGEFERKIGFFGITLWQSDHLHLDKLAKTYSKNFKEDVIAGYQDIGARHRNSGHRWIQSLLDDIYENIVEYSPELSRQAKQIKTMTRQIEELIVRQGRLKEYTNELVAMMNWKISGR